GARSPARAGVVWAKAAVARARWAKRSPPRDPPPVRCVSQSSCFAMPAPLLLLQEINLTFGVAPLLSGAQFAVAAGDRICMVGRNGSGKSTLLRIAAGLVQPDAGYRFAQPGATICYLSQEPDLSGFATTLAYVEAGFSADADGRHRALYLLKELRVGRRSACFHHPRRIWRT